MNIYTVNDERCRARVHTTNVNSIIEIRTVFYPWLQTAEYKVLNFLSDSYRPISYIVRLAVNIVWKIGFKVGKNMLGVASLVLPIARYWPIPRIRFPSGGNVIRKKKTGASDEEFEVFTGFFKSVYWMYAVYPFLISDILYLIFLHH